jgi:hypothetical protein
MTLLLFLFTFITYRTRDFWLLYNYKNYLIFERVLVFYIEFIDIFLAVVFFIYLSFGSMALNNFIHNILI